MEKVKQKGMKVKVRSVQSINKNKCKSLWSKILKQNIKFLFFFRSLNYSSVNNIINLSIWEWRAGVHKAATILSVLVHPKSSNSLLIQTQISTTFRYLIHWTSSFPQCVTEKSSQNQRKRDWETDQRKSKDTENFHDDFPEKKVKISSGEDA